MSKNAVWMQTFTGKAFSFPVTQDMLCIEDIAHSLAYTCRYNGHATRFYSTAEHSVLISRWLEETYGSIELARSGLMHDAGEAYVCDVPRPLKRQLSKYHDFEHEVNLAIEKWLGLDEELGLEPSQVKEADWRILGDEKAVLMAPEPQDWYLSPAGPLGVKIECWSPERAYSEFLDAYDRLFQRSREDDRQ